VEGRGPESFRPGEATFVGVILREGGDPPSRGRYEKLVKGGRAFNEGGKRAFAKGIPSLPKRAAKTGSGELCGNSAACARPRRQLRKVGSRVIATSEVHRAPRIATLARGDQGPGSGRR